jgi:hypothetical protein
LEQRAKLSVHGLFARKGRDRVEHATELVEKLLRHDPLRLTGATRWLWPRDRRRVGPVLRLRLAVEARERIGDDLIEDGLNRRFVFGRIVLENAGNGVGERRRAPEDGLDSGRFLALPVRTDQEVEAGLCPVGFADMAELIRALVVESVSTGSASPISARRARS